MLVQILAISTALGVTAANAEASTVSISDVFNPTDVMISNSGASICTGTNGSTDAITGANGSGCKQLDYTHVLTGFSNPPMTLTSAWLTVFAYNDGDTEEVAFKIKLDAGGELFYNVSTGSNQGAPDSFAFNVHTLVSSDGQLVVNLKKQSGDFYFARSVLDATWETEPVIPAVPAPTPVPEPASLVLLGAGLLLTASRLRRRVS